MSAREVMLDTVSRRVNAERLVVLGWSRAILLQLAHPLVAAGVADHSSFRSGGMSAIFRLHHTIRAMLALTFGDDRSRTAALDAIRHIHKRVHGHLPTAAGIFPAGTWYSAEDPDLVLWVHATLVESIPMIHGHIISPVTSDQCDRYCAEAADVAVELGARDQEVPRTWRELTAYLERMYASGAIAVSAQAREVASAVLAPPLPRVVAPVAWMNRLITVGLLPERIREEYGFSWSTRQQRSLRSVFRVLAQGRRISPSVLALWPEARKAHA